MQHIYWSGPRESDTAYTGELIRESATFYGSNSGRNTAFCAEKSVRINHNIFHQDASDFILNWQKSILKKDPDCCFMSYNPNCVYGAPEEIVNHTICLNDENIMHSLDNKMEFRKVFGKEVPLLEVRVVRGLDCRIDRLQKYKNFENANAFIVQEAVASGGEGTYLLDSRSEKFVIEQLSDLTYYLVSVYRKNNISVNTHVMIYDDGYLIFPGSVQVIQKCGNRLLYRGGDFVLYEKLSEYIREQFYYGTVNICRKLVEMGYRGIAGIDAMICGSDIYFLEINNRFQGSSLILNKALEENNMPSLQQLNIRAFTDGLVDHELQQKLKSLSVPYSMYTCINEASGIHTQHLHNAASGERQVAEIVREGYDPTQETELYANQFTLVFNTNIVGFDNEGGIRIHPNLVFPDEKEYQDILEKNWTTIKIALINRGVVLTEAAKAYIQKHGQMREGTYFSLDLFMQGFYANAPLYVKFTALSPFKVDYDEHDNSLFISWYGKRITRVDYDVKMNLSKGIKKVAPYFEKICFLATDRLRLQNNSYCSFMKHGVGCKFCEAVGIDNGFHEKDILECIDIIFQENECLPFRHILIGGLSNEIGYERDTIIRMCKKIRQYTDMPIYLMCLPPKDENIREYYEAGVTEFGFNMEIYDTGLAKQYMPGKAGFSRLRYLKALGKAVSYVGNKGKVRCAFVAGLEPMESLLDGIEEVCKVGAAPILSVFRPIPGTEMSEVIPPSDEWLLELTEKAEHICKRYGLSLGPDCPACRNNTLTYVTQGEVYALNSDGWRKSII